LFPVGARHGPVVGPRVGVREDVAVARINRPTNRARRHFAGATQNGRRVDDLDRRLASSTTDATPGPATAGPATGGARSRPPRGRRDGRASAAPRPARLPREVLPPRW
jgi:hypothetical protein